MIVSDDSNIHCTKPVIHSTLANKGVEYIIMPTSSPSLNPAEFINFVVTKILLPKEKINRDNFDSVLKRVLTTIDRKYEMCALVWGFKGLRLS